MASALLLAPSAGLGGGIERYAAAVQAVFDGEGVRYRRLNLCDPDHPLTVATRVRFLAAARRAVATATGPVRLVIAHRNLLPVVSLVSRLPTFGGAAVILHGAEVWGGRRTRGRYWLRRPDVRAIAVSGYTAGAIARIAAATVLPPGIAPDWYDTLVRAGTTTTRAPDELFHLVTAFRLASWEEKGLDTILDAIILLNSRRVRLTICGTGPVSSRLRTRVAALRWCRIRADLSDTELAQQLAEADTVVLATRTTPGRRASGEGFGLVLLEAQLTGTPVIAPAFGGSGDAFQPGFTGLAPVDESPRALAGELADLLEDEKRRRELGEAAAAWARTRFHPETYARQLLRALLS